MASLAVRTPEPENAVATPARTIIYLGMDVHKDSITIAVLPGAAKTPTQLERLANDLPKLKKWIDRVAQAWRDSRLLRSERRGLCAAPRDARVGLRV